MRANSQKLLFSFNIAVLGAATGFAFMVWYYLARVPDHLQTEFLRSQHEPDRLNGLSAAFIYGSTTISGFIIAFIFIFWLYDKPQNSGVSKFTWILSSLGYAVANAFIGGGIFMPLADIILKSIYVSSDIGTTILVISDHLFRIPLTMWLFGTQVLYSSLISGFIFGLGALFIYKIHESESLSNSKQTFTIISTAAFSTIIVVVSLILPVSVLKHLG